MPFVATGLLSVHPGRKRSAEKRTHGIVVVDLRQLVVFTGNLPLPPLPPLYGSYSLSVKRIHKNLFRISSEDLALAKRDGIFLGLKTLSLQGDKDVESHYAV